ncbi:serine hydrolase domain-containing protein [Albibacterium sp.]|uniref:serine hydrolase domain-containing protein n=1 Tax=Albibacterium sp. TaxID=2952885 RepID=UPI002BC83F26|nr:serine hydrolase domain-containing protein [Albibacterium sp.]HUH18336.1 serine hydrolase domain-containing protein [Albibacterium sp.]
MKRIFLAAILIGFIIQSAIAQDFDKAKLDNYFDALEANNKFMGSVAVSQKDRIVYARSVGFSDVENNVKANENSKYRIGSISKTFTSVLVLKAIEEKKLDINQTIVTFFPSIPNAGKITIKDLLSHRSGIHNFTNEEDYLTWNTQAKSEKEMVEIIAKNESDFEPGSKAEYSNSNFVLLTYILEKTFKKSYAELLIEYIARPVGLTNTYLGTKINVKNNETKSYSYADNWKVEKETDISIPLGAGGIVSTPSDLVKFSDALFNGKLLNKESLELMKTIKDNFGIGLFQIPFYDKIGYGHNGGIDGFSSIFSYFSDGDISYALTSNGTNFNINDISIAVLSTVYNKPYDIPDFKMYEVRLEELNQYLGVYSSTQIPLKITITKENITLIAQATGQASFPLEATEKDKFKFTQGGISLEFNPTEKTMILKQGGGQFLFKKD